jgi:hypothetical protein
MTTRNESHADRRLRHLLTMGLWHEDELLWLLRQPRVSDQLRMTIQQKLAAICIATGPERLFVTDREHWGEAWKNPSVDPKAE